jgi:hypothetical protein
MWGDYYDVQGNKIGTDGKDDGKNYVVTNRVDIAKIKQATEKGVNVQAEDVKMGIQLPSYKVRQKMGEAVDKSNSPSAYAGDDVGGKHEEGGIVGTDQNGEEVAMHSMPGKVAAPGERTVGVDPLQTDFAQDGASVAGNIETRNTMTATGTYHVHPSGKGPSGGNYVQEPSVADLRVTQNDKTIRGMEGNSYVLGARNNTVYILAPSATGIHARQIATFPLDKFRTIK